MEITAIYGESGTGKSTSALSYAHEHQIEAIIDDGLLIMGGKKIAGISAKFEKTTTMQQAQQRPKTTIQQINKRIQKLLLQTKAV